MADEVGTAVEGGVLGVGPVVGVVGEVAGQGTNTKTRGKATQNTQNQRGGGKQQLNIAGLSHVFLNRCYWREWKDRPRDISEQSWTRNMVANIGFCGFAQSPQPVLIRSVSSLL